MSTIQKKPPPSTTSSQKSGAIPGNGAGGVGGAGNIGPSGGAHGAGPLGDVDKGAKTKSGTGIADVQAQGPVGKAETSAQMQQTSSVKAQVFQAPPFDPKQPAEAQLLVAGTGIGGGPLSRLAEQGFQVKMLEAGPPQRDWFCDIPLLHGKSSDDSFLVDGYSPPMALAAYFVQHYEEQQKNVDLKMHEDLGGILYPRGQGIGGSGNVNANVAVMPDKQSLEGLYIQTGKDPRFAPNNLQKFFARAQDPGPLFAFLQTLGHVVTAGRHAGIKDFARLTEPGGWQQLTTALNHLGFKDLTADPQLGKIVLHMLAFTAKQSVAEGKLGDILMRMFTLFDGSNNELNSGREGFTLMQISVGKDGKRSSVADRIRAVMATRPDTMSVECETKVHSLVFNKEGTRVEGMRVLKPNAEVLAQRQVIYALKQNVPNVPADKIADYNQKIEAETQKLRVLEQTTQPEMEIRRSSQGYVLSAGTFEDPMILIRSGYGPKDVLDKLGIPPVGGVYHEAVGRNLKDRREITVIYHAKDKFALIDGLGLGKNPHSDEAMKVWDKSGRGAYATNGVVASYQFKSDPSQKEADIFAFFVPGGFRGYDTGYAVDGEKYPQTFTAILLDKNGNLIGGDTDHPMSPEELATLRDKLGRVEPDAGDPNHMKVAANFNYQRPKPGENPPLYSAMVRMKELFKGQDILTELVPGDPFDKMSSTSLGELLAQVTTREMFPKHAADDVRSAEDWFKSMDIPLKDKSGADVNLTVERDGAKAKLSIAGKPVTEAQLAALTMYDGKKLDASSLKAALTRQFMIEFQFSQQWGHHANGTCAMGLDPQNTVIAPDFHVWGPDGKKIENLWVTSASGTPAPVNPGPFIQLYIAGAIGEAGADAIGEQLRANENHLGRMSPLATRLPAESSSKNAFGENLLIAIDRSRGHVGDAQGVLTGEALTQLIAMQKAQGFSKKDVALAEQVYEHAAAHHDKNAPILKVLADEVRRMQIDQGLWLDIKSAVRRTGNHLKNDEIMRIVRETTTTPPGTAPPTT